MSESGQAGGSGAFRVAPQLTGKAQQAYAAMAAEDTGDYDQLKAAIFQRYSITETYRVRFRSVARARKESYTEMASRVMDLARKWPRKCTDADSVWEVFTVEQLLNSMAGLEGRRVQEAAREPSKTVSGGPRQCYTCGKPGHLAKDCSLEEAVMPFSQFTESRGRPKLTKNQKQGNRRQREEDIARERRQREEEVAAGRRQREEEVAAERRERKEDIARERRQREEETERRLR